MKPILLTLLIATCLFGCNQRNKLNTNEQKLAAQIKAEELEKKEAEAAEDQNLPAIPDTLPPGFRFQEDRSVDPENPPELIDIAGNLNNKKAMKLSDVGKQIRYIRLAPPPDSLFVYAPPRISFTKTNIIARSNRFAACVYSMEGDFVDVICKSELKESLGSPPPFPNIPYFGKYNNMPKQLKTLRKGRGVQNKGITDIYANNFSGENIYFKYRDRQNGTAYLMKYNVSKDSKSVVLSSNEETKDEVISKGEKVAPLGEKSTFKYHILDENTKVGYQSKWNSVQNGTMLLMQNMQGDTLCVFNESERITNYDATLVRSVESGSKYFYENTFTYRPSFNDTVFRVIPPNRLLPVFMLNLGEHKTTALEALHPRVSLDGKFLIRDWLESSKWIFIIYTENRVSINSIKNQKVKFFYACYDKMAKELFHFPVSPLNYVYKIENDIDGGLPMWPKQITPDGKLYKYFEGWELKRHVKSDQFRQSGVSQEKKEKIIRLAEDASDAETVIMIIE